MKLGEQTPAIITGGASGLGAAVATALRAEGVPVGILDMNAREIAVFAPLVVLVIFMGVYPGPFLEIMHVSVTNLLTHVDTALNAGQAITVAGR